MSVAVEDLRPAAPAPGGPSALLWALRDVWLVMGRHLRHVRRVPQVLFFSTVQPLVFMLLLASVFGRAVHVPGVDYRVFMVPGAFVQSMAFAGAGTSVGLADDLRNGFVDRYRSLPMARFAVLAGRISADVVRNVLIVVWLGIAAQLVGFHPTTGPLAVLGGILVLMGFGFMFSCVGAVIGLLARTPEAAHMGTSVWIFPVTYVSSAFVPSSRLPIWLRWWSDISPVTAAVDAMRALFIGYGSATGPVLLGLAWFVGVPAVCLPLAVRLFNRSANR